MQDVKDPLDGIVHEVRWGDALPWWLLFRAARTAFSPTVILLAALGALAAWGGGAAADRLGIPGLDRDADSIAANAGDDLALPSGGTATGRLPRGGVSRWLDAAVDRLPGPVRDALQLVCAPFRADLPVGRMAGAMARIAWFILAWSIFGTAISRHVALRLVGEEAPGLLGSCWFGTRKWLAAFNSVLFVLAGIAALSIPGALLGLAMRTDWGLTFAGAVWPLVLCGAIVLAILAVGLVAGWPLMVAAVGVERGDSFQAISTAFSYVYQRPLHYAFYALVTLLVAVPTFAVAAGFADVTAALAMWAARAGMGHDRAGDLLAGLSGAGPLAGHWGARAIAFWMRGIGSLLTSFGWGYLWAMVTAIYMLLRRDVDGTELDEVVLEEPAGES